MPTAVLDDGLATGPLAPKGPAAIEYGGGVIPMMDWFSQNGQSKTYFMYGVVSDNAAMFTTHSAAMSRE